MPTTLGDPANKELSLTFFVDPGNRVYVRHITFNGVTKINDEVLRREMRQLEGGWLSNVALDRSKQRLERLPYIKKVEFGDQAGGRLRGPGRRELRDRGGSVARSSAAASATRSRSRSSSAATTPTRTSSARAGAWPST